MTDFASIEWHEYAALALTLGIIVFAVVTAIMLVRTRARAAAVEAAVRDKIAALEGAVDRADILLQSDPQLLAVWSAGAEQPEIIGDPSLVAVQDIAIVAARLRHLARPRTRAHHDVRGRRAARRRARLLRCRWSRSGGRAYRGRRPRRRRARHSAAARDRRHRARASPKWRPSIASCRAMSTRCACSSKRCLRRSGCATRPAASPSSIRPTRARSKQPIRKRPSTSGVELLDRGAREELRLGIAGGLNYSRRRPAIVAGKRRVLDVLAVPTPSGSAGIGIDVTDAEAMRGDIARMVEAHRRTLDQLATGGRHLRRRAPADVLQRRLPRIVGPRRRLPRPGADRFRRPRRLRAARRLPEQQDFRQWRTQLHEAYPATETRQHEWHLPDGRTLRVVTTPNPEGGVTYLFDDVTERLDLERRFDALIRVQGETLDNLGEARRGVRQRRPAAAVQPGVRAAVAARPGRAFRASAHRDRHRWCRAASPQRRDLGGTARRGDRARRAHAAAAAHRAYRRQRARLRDDPAARRRDAGHVHRRDRVGKRRARPARAQRSAGRGRRSSR